MLLTGASGFVGSHILDKLREQQLRTALLLRASSDTRFIRSHLNHVEVCPGSVEDPPSLHEALNSVTHVIHCAGRTRAVKASEFYLTNHRGTKNLVQAVNQNAASIQKFVHISSLAAFGPAVPAHPAVEDLQPNPVSHYGKSKLAAELDVQQQCRPPFTILRPPAVYGPRDTGFLSMFKAVKNHLLPRPSKTQALSLAYVKDLAETVVACLLNPATTGRTYFVASPEIVTGRTMAEEIAAQMKRWTIPFPIPSLVLWAICLFEQIVSQITRQARLLSLHKYAELRAPGWVCSPLRLQQEAGLICRTRLREGVAETLDWYTRERWL